ncbi:MAG: ABC transporter ATP-binding protein [Nitrospirae bacterium]|nr:ABC transporter ATP-binding protein [Nitrospirota bacterium]
MAADGRRSTTVARDSSLLRIKDLNIHFRKRGGPSAAVSGLELEIRHGETFGLAGESGCGKSITALSIMGLLPASARATGKILFSPRDREEVDLLSLDSAALRSVRGKEIGMVFQEPMTSLNPVFTIGYQVAEVLTTHEGLSARAATEKAVELLRLVHIPSPERRIKDYPHQLSGGMRQRVMIAMAVACNPSLLIADEPTTALDVTIQAEILNLLVDIKENRGMSVLLITHDLAIISENADRVAVMYAGRIVEIAPVDLLFRKPAHPYTQGLLQSLPVARNIQLKPIPGSVPAPDELPPGCKFSPRCAYRTGACDTEEPQLRMIEQDHGTRCIRAEEIVRQGATWNY